MGEVVSARADLATVEDHVRRTLRKATARGLEIASAARTRLRTAVADIDSALALLRSAADTEAVAWAAVLAEDGNSDGGIVAVRDAMWNALGRPRQSPHMDRIFPDGVATYTSGDPSLQPVLMQILRSRILAGTAPQWTESLRAGWAAEIEALRVPYEAAVAAHRPAEAAATIAEVGYRTAVRTAHARLRAFKRDLEGLGLSSKQIFEIIPDASKSVVGARAIVEPST